MEVHRAAHLVFGDLGVLHRCDGAELGLTHPQQVGDATTKADDEPSPEFRRVPLPHDVSGVVVAARAQRGADDSLVVVATAALGGPVAAPWAPGLRSAAGLSRRRAMDRAEARSGERHEEQRVVADVLGHLLATSDTRTKHLEGVGGVEARAGGAHGGAAVAACLVGHPEWRVARGVGAEHLARGLVGRGRGADELHRPRAISDLGEGVGEGPHGARGEPGRQVVEGLRREAGQVQPEVLGTVATNRLRGLQAGAVRGHAASPGR